MELQSATKSYPGTPPVLALDGVSLAIEPGEMVGVVGPSGCGKSTMLHMMGTLDRPSSGKVLVDGLDTSELSERHLSAIRGRKLGFVFQRFFLLSGTSALENVAGGLLYLGAPPRERRERAAAALDRVGLGNRKSHIPSKMSGGERQRVAIARALVHDPSLILADEPTGNLDSRASASIIELFERLHAEGSTIVVVTHNDEIAAELPRIVRLLDGQVQSDERQTR
ncbi:MAG: ABC transporter ATP-binding protein [Acidimicrobiaceae bacterium]|nr:ABC transporter ATP-binding protein [Acidimicrobiaceae bacterium]MXW75443.1 ABC transporter ATP-binding protein [Acidimicrobiaceae bacterium]MYC43829.1 ABC transporter ATP-binding protein [Acidimicrobiaceae bacterium]MYD05976.1 ABC transporter ATP-binding protein [Acidimicrobiaceae bacterium]MYH87545.1 ABC transporter ATP-binding protein [Acidimicrobiaceae bacterium]